MESLDKNPTPAGLTRTLCVLMLMVFFSENVKATDSNVLRLTHFDVIRNSSEHYDTNISGTSITLPDSWYEHQQNPFRNSWYHTKLTLATNNTPFTIYIPRVSMNASVTVNGKEIGNGGRFTEPISRNHGRPLLFTAPNWITQDSNIIDLVIRVSDNSWAFGYLGPIYVGDSATLNGMYRVREFWQIHLTMALALLMLIFSIASLIIFIGRGKEKYYLWFGVAMFLFAVDTFNVFVIDIPLDRYLWEIYSQMIIFAFAMATIIFIHRFTKVGWKGVEPILGAAFIVKLIVLVIIDVEYLFMAGSVFNLVVIVYGLILAFLVTHSYIKTSSFETGIAALAGVILLAVAFHTWLVQIGIVDPENLHIIHYGAPCFFLLISLSLVRKFFNSLESAETLTCELDTRVRDKEKELAATYEKLNISNQKRILSDERERIMREVHDGFGSHLIGAMTMLETNKVNKKELLDYLKSSLLDLRIMIDSLDPKTHEVSIALSMLRTRVEPLLKNRNITLDWDLYKLPNDLKLNPNKTLSLLRVMQELITNIIKHSVASKLEITSFIQSTGQERILLIDILENGNGFDHNLHSGRGLRNIKKRMKDLGGEIIFNNDVSEVKTSIIIPGFPLDN